MASLPHIAFICSRLDLPGGIERAIVNTAHLFINKGHHVTIITADETDASFYPIDKAVRLLHAPLFFGMNANESWLKRKLSFVADVRQLRHIIQTASPDVVIATEYPFSIAAILSGATKKIRLISWEHFHFYELKKSRFWKQLTKVCYPHLDAIVVLNNDEQRLFGMLNKTCIVIPNFIEAADTTNTVKRKKRILTVAHLSTRKKGFDLFPAIAQEVLSRSEGWEWKVIGSGEEKENITRFIKENYLEDKIILQEPVASHLDDEYAAASIFVLLSRYECFPMTLLEAMRQGLPCVAFDCETGPRAIIKNSENGFLVEKENSAQFIDVLSGLLNDSNAIDTMRETATETARHYSPERIYSLWQNLFTLLLKDGPNDQYVPGDKETD